MTSRACSSSPTCPATRTGSTSSAGPCSTSTSSRPCYVTALFLDILDTTIVNVALPTLGRDFHSGNAEWVVLGYTLSLAVWIPASGWLGDRFGTKRMFLFAFAAFIGGSLLCAPRSRSAS